MGLSYVKARLEESFGTNFILDYGEDDQRRWRTTILITAEALI